MEAKTNWDQIKEWDKKYYMHNRVIEKDYVPFPIDHTESTDTLVAADGTKYLDFQNQAICVNTGQTNEHIKARMHECIDRFGFVLDGYLVDYKAKACKIIMEDLLGSDNWAGRIKIVTDGSDAVEAAAYIARIFTGKPIIATRDYSYHGWTGTAVSLTQVRTSRNGFWSPLENKQVTNCEQSYSAPVISGPAPHCFRCPLGHKKEVCLASGKEYPCVTMLRKRIEYAGIDSVAALITEPIQGVGSIVPPEGYIKQIRQMTKEMGILWIADEIITGFGRTGEWFAYQLYDVTPDILILGKGLANSAAAVSAVVVSKEISKYFDTVWWKCINTFSASPLSMAALLGNLEFMLANDVPQKAKKVGEILGARLKAMEKKYTCVGSVEGGAALWTMELVKDAQNTPFVAQDRNWAPGDDMPPAPTGIIRAKAMERGAIFGGFMPNTLRIATSLVISEDDIHKGMDALEYALDHLESTL